MDTFRITFITLLALFAAALAPGAEIALSWDDNSENEDGFHIERFNSTQWERIASVPAFPGKSPPRVEYVDTGLEPGTVYSYRVRAYNAAGQSLPSNVAAAKTPPATPPVVVPPAPSNSIATPRQPAPATP